MKKVFNLFLKYVYIYIYRSYFLLKWHWRLTVFINILLGKWKCWDEWAKRKRMLTCKNASFWPRTAATACLASSQVRLPFATSKFKSNCFKYHWFRLKRSRREEKSRIEDNQSRCSRQNSDQVNNFPLRSTNISQLFVN